MKFQGGESAVQRLMQAYGFTMKKQLGDHLGAGTGTISTWVKRDYFPGEAIVRCSLETGVSLKWLATGQDESFTLANKSPEKSAKTIPKKSLLAGTLQDKGMCLIDSSILDGADGRYCYIEKSNTSWIVNFDITTISNGKWLIDIEGSLDIYRVTRLPLNRLKLTGEGTDFECNSNDVKVIALVLITIQKD